MCKCSQEDCNLEVFENSDKCILHCKKDDWYDIDDNGKKNWDKSKEEITIFWEIFYKKYDSKQIVLGIKNVIFPEFESKGGLSKQSPRKTIFEYLDSYLRFEDCIFEDDIFLYKYIHELEFKECKFFANVKIKRMDIEKGISFEKCIFNKSLILKNITFKEGSKVKIKECQKIVNASFENTTFEDLADFYNSTFETKTNFERTTFKNISVFSNVIFKDDIDFRFTTFEKLAQFKETIFEKKLNLEDTIIKDKINFLKTKTLNNENLKPENIANRETARIIKDSFEQQNNIIEANKFYALEMKEREKELDSKKDFFEWLVFKFHGLSSNHSQDWTLVLFWIMNINFFYSYLNIETNMWRLALEIPISLILISLIGCMIFKISEDNEKKRWLTTIPITMVCYFFYGYLVEKDWLLSEYSKNLNPFSIMRADEPINFGTLLYKITIAYLIYQLIISIRQNTRRK